MFLRFSTVNRNPYKIQTRYLVVNPNLLSTIGNSLNLIFKILGDFLSYKSPKLPDERSFFSRICIKSWNYSQKDRFEMDLKTLGF